APLQDEAVSEHVGERSEEPDDQVSEAKPRAEERLESPPEVHRRGRALEPHRVPIREPERRKQDREGVRDERGVEVGEVARSDEDERSQHECSESTPGACTKNFRAHGEHRQALGPSGSPVTPWCYRRTESVNAWVVAWRPREKRASSSRAIARSSDERA